MILPLGCILIAYYWSKLGFLRVVLIMILVIQAMLFWRPQPQQKLQFAVNDLTNGNYYELYQHLTVASKQQISRNDFYLQLKSFDHQLLVSSASAQIYFPTVLPWTNTVPLTVALERTTPLGVLTTISQTLATRENNVWKLEWNSDIMHPEWEPGSTVKTTLKSDLQPALKTNDANILTEYRLWPFIYLDRTQLSYSSELINRLSEATGISTVDLENKIIVQYHHFDRIPIGFVRDDFSESDLADLHQQRGLVAIEEPKLVTADLSNSEQNILDALMQTQGLMYQQETGSSVLKKPSGEEIILLQRDNLTSEQATLEKSFAEIFGRPANLKP